VPEVQVGLTSLCY